MVVNFVHLGNMSYGKDIPRRVQQFTVFFAKCAFSQHTRCTLTIDGHRFQSALHYMLYEKACEYIVLHCSINLCDYYKIKFHLSPGAKKWYLAVSVCSNSDAVDVLCCYFFCKSASDILADISSQINFSHNYYEIVPQNSCWPVWASYRPYFNVCHSQ